MKKISNFLLFFLLLGSYFLNAQQTTSSSGVITTSSSGQMSFVVGQFNYETKGTSSFITGGVLQVYQRAIHIPINPLQISVWPNPVATFLSVKIEGSSETEISYQILDLIGHLVEEQKLDILTPSIDMHSYKPGFYIIQILVPNQNPVQFKVIKI